MENHIGEAERDAERLGRLDLRKTMAAWEGPLIAAELKSKLKDACHADITSFDRNFIFSHTLSLSRTHALSLSLSVSLSLALALSLRASITLRLNFGFSLAN